MCIFRAKSAVWEACWGVDSVGMDAKRLVDRADNHLAQSRTHIACMCLTWRVLGLQMGCSRAGPHWGGCRPVERFSRTGLWLTLQSPSVWHLEELCKANQSRVRVLGAWRDGQILGWGQAMGAFFEPGWASVRRLGRRFRRNGWQKVSQ